MKRLFLFLLLVGLFVGACGQSASQTFNKIIIAKQGIQFGDGTVQLTAGGTSGSMTYPAAGIPISTGNSWSTSIVNNSTNWNTAYAWGNHAGLYRPVTYVPTWNDVTGKPTTFTPAVHTHIWTDITTGKPTTLAGYGITNAMATTHAANAITTTNITSWNTAVSWGNHAGLYKSASYAPSWTEITGKPAEEDLSVAITPYLGNIESYTTVQINALIPTSVKIVLDTTIGALKVWNGTVWKVIILSE